MTMTALDQTYHERNLLAVAFAAAMRELGYAVGTQPDPDFPGWPLLIVETPAGQLSWHILAHELPPGLLPHTSEWHGASTPEQHERLRELWTHDIRSVRPDPQDPPRPLAPGSTPRP